MTKRPKVIGTNGNDDFLVTAPMAVDGLNGVDVIRFDFSSYQGRIFLDLEGLWSGGTGSLNGFTIRNVEVLGSGLGQTDTENRFVLGSNFSDFIRLGSDFVQAPSVVIGLEGDDTIFGGNYESGTGLQSNYLNGGSGNDRVTGGIAGDAIIGEDGDDELYGEGGDDLILGDGGRDRLFGGKGDDGLLGGADNDRLSGGEGNDLLDGGSGADRMMGGAGADQFRFSSLLDIDAGDLITDFKASEGDRIDLSSVGDAAGLSLSFVGSTPFSGLAGEVRVEGAGNSWLVSGDLDGDASADFVFSVRSVAALSQSDFNLGFSAPTSEMLQADVVI